MTENEIKYYTVREVSKIMRKSRSVIYDWIGQGKTPHFKVPNSQSYLISKEPFENWLKKNTHRCSQVRSF